MMEPDPKPETQSDRRPSRRFSRWLALAVVLLVVVPLVGAVALKAMFPPERLREIAEPQLEKRIARDVHLGGVSLKLFPGLAIRLTDVRIANPAEGFSEHPALAADALDLRLELLPLLRRQFHMSEVRLVRPVLRYEVAPNGANNLTGLLVNDDAAAADDESPGDPTGTGSSLDIKDFVVTDGAVLYVDSEARRALRVGLAGRLGVDEAERAGGPLASAGRFSLSEGLLVRRGSDTLRLPDLAVEYRAVFEPSGERVAVPELAIRGAGLDLGGEAASRRDSATRVRTLRLDLSSNEFDIGDFIAGLPDGVAPDTIEVDGRARVEIRYTGTTASGDGSQPGTGLSGSAQVENVSITTPRRGRLADAVRGSMTFSTTTVSTPNLSGRLLGRPFEARVEIAGLAEPNPTIAGHLSGEFGLEQLNDFRTEPSLPVEGEAAVEVDFRGPASDASRWDLSGPIRLSNVSYASESLPAPVTVAGATLQLTGSGVRGDGVQARLGGSDLTLTFSAPGLVRHFLTGRAARGAAPQVDFTARSSRLQAVDLRRGSADVGYSDLLKARLAGKQVEGQPPEAIAGGRFRRPDLSQVRASGTVAIEEWINPPTNAEAVSFQVSMVDGVVDITRVSGQVYGGSLSGGLRANLGEAGPPYRVEYDLHLRGARAGALIERWTRLGRALSGSLDFDIEGMAPLDEAFLPITTGFEASGSTNFVEGRFEDFGLTQAVRTHLALGAENLRGFRDLGGPFEIRDGQFVVRNWTFSTGGVQAAVSGAAGLAGILDLDLALQLPPSLLRGTPVAGANATLSGLIDQVGAGGGASEPVPLRLAVGGTMTRPTIGIDTDALTTTLRARTVDAGRQRVEQEGRDRLERAAGGLLDRLREGVRGDTVAGDTASP